MSLQLLKKKIYIGQTYSVQKKIHSTTLGLVKGNFTRETTRKLFQSHIFQSCSFTSSMELQFPCYQILQKHRFVFLTLSFFNIITKLKLEMARNQKWLSLFENKVIFYMLQYYLSDKQTVFKKSCLNKQLQTRSK